MNVGFGWQISRGRDYVHKNALFCIISHNENTPRSGTEYRYADPPLLLKPDVPHRLQPYSVRSLTLASWTV